MVVAEPRSGSRASASFRYYLRSLPDDAAPLGDAVRAHWRIEKSVHWVLEIAVRVDESASARVMPTRIHRFCVARPQSAASGTDRHDGIKAERLRAGWGYPYLLRVIEP